MPCAWEEYAISALIVGKKVLTMDNYCFNLSLNILPENIMYFWTSVKICKKERTKK